MYSSPVPRGVRPAAGCRNEYDMKTPFLRVFACVQEDSVSGDGSRVGTIPSRHNKQHSFGYMDYECYLSVSEGCVEK